MKNTYCKCGHKTAVAIRFSDTHLITERVCFECGRVTRIRFVQKAEPKAEVKQ